MASPPIGNVPATLDFVDSGNRWQAMIRRIYEQVAKVINYQCIRTPVLLPVYANNASAVAAGLAVGSLYRTNGDPDTVCVVH
jgi:hypothetical protein